MVVNTRLDVVVSAIPIIVCVLDDNDAVLLAAVDVVVVRADVVADGVPAKSENDMVYFVVSLVFCGLLLL